MAKQNKKNQQKQAQSKNKGQAKPKQNNKKKTQTRKMSNTIAINSVNEGVGFSVKPFKQQDQSLEGCDYFQDIIITAGSPATSNSAVLFSAPINPLSLIPNSRLQRFAGLYDKWRLEEMSFFFATSVATSTNGALLMAWDADTDDDYSQVTGTALLTELNSTQANINFSVYRNANMRIPRSQELFVQAEQSGDPRLVNHGRLWVASEGGLAAGTYGRIMVKWRVKFSRPNLDPDVADSPYASSITAPNGTYISNTYPWGDFSNIIANSSVSVSANYNPDIVKWQSTIPGTATAASVIVFSLAGQYRINLARTGSAMTVGAYTPTGTSNVVFGGSGVTAAGFPFTTQSFNALASASTSIGYFDVNAAAGGYIYATGDTTPTHTTSYVTVMRFPATNIPPPVDQIAKLETQEIKELKEWLIKMKISANAMKVLPDVANLTSQTVTTTNTVPSPAGEPVQTSISVGDTAGNVGPVEVVVLDPPPTMKDTPLRNHVVGVAKSIGLSNEQTLLATLRLYMEYSEDMIANMNTAGLTRALQGCLHENWSVPQSQFVTPWNRH